jgi:hypothetical protein
VVSVEMGMIVVSKYIYGDFDTDEAVDWAIKNCPSFVKYMVIELDFEEKLELDCWFRFDIYFTDPKEATFYSLMWG